MRTVPQTPVPRNKTIPSRTYENVDEDGGLCRKTSTAGCDAGLMMIQGSINIDDAGNPGTESGSEFLSETRKSWTAVIIPSSVARDVSTAMDIFLTGVSGEFKAAELHFTDIYGGRGVWRDVKVAKRIEVFEIMTNLMESFALPVIHQTASAETLNDLPQVFSRLQRAPGAWWDIKNIAHFGFLLLCFNVSKHLRELHAESPKDFELPLPAYVDEGLAKAGACIDLPNWGDVIEGQKVVFCRSRENLGIQIADFAAFAISRTQWIVVQQKLGEPVSESDMLFLKTTARLNILNLPMFSFSANNLSREAYEFFLSKDRLEKGLPARPRKFPRTT